MSKLTENLYEELLAAIDVLDEKRQNYERAKADLFNNFRARCNNVDVFDKLLDSDTGTQFTVVPS